MTQASSYLLAVAIYDLSMLSASEFCALDLAPVIFAFLFLQKQKLRTAIWLAWLNIFAVFIALSYALNGDFLNAKAVFIRTNLIVGLALGLFLGREQFFLIQALSQLKVSQKIIAIMLINNKLFEELLERASKIPAVLKARGVRVGTSIFTYRAYANLLGKMIVLGLDRSFEIHRTMLARGYSGRLSFLPASPLRVRDLALLALVVAVFSARILKGLP